MRREVQIYFLFNACLLAHLWSTYIASPYFFSLLIHKKSITVPIPQLYLEVNFLGCLYQKKKKGIIISISLVPNYTMTLAGMLSTLQFSHGNMSPKLVLERDENWKGLKIIKHAMLAWNIILSYFITCYLFSRSCYLSFPWRLDYFCILSPCFTGLSLQPTKIQG